MDNNQIYHFVKVKTKGDEDSKGTWLLEADSLRIINETYLQVSFFVFIFVL